MINRYTDRPLWVSSNFGYFNGPPYSKDMTASVDPKALVGPNATIMRAAFVGPEARIPAGAVVFGRVRIEKDDWFISVGPIGSRNDYLTAVRVRKKRELRWWTGCQHGITTKRLRQRVNGRIPSFKADYLNAINFVTKHPALRRHIRAHTKRAK